ncbi:uncharacterized protein LOC143882562 [Tasmannia lanceolata]|uniref:uncharacterized protein LOC143882562 n=1 Tax=Tasmannia lanceolata TaxID=3420 RepID=UPI004062C30D
MMGTAYHPDWKIGQEDNGLQNPRVGFEMGFALALPEEKAELEALSPPAPTASLYHYLHCVQSVAGRVVSQMFESGGEVNLLKERIQSLESSLAGYKDAANVHKTEVASFESVLKEERAAKEAIESELAILKVSVQEKVEAAKERAVNEYLEFEDYRLSVALSCVPFILCGFNDCKDQGLSIDSEFDVSRLIHKSERKAIGEKGSSAAEAIQEEDVVEEEREKEVENDATDGNKSISNVIEGDHEGDQ